MDSCSPVHTTPSDIDDGHPEHMAACDGRGLDYLGVDILLLIFDEVAYQQITPLAL